MFMPSCAGYGHEMASGSSDLWRHRRMWTVAYRLRSCERLEQLLIGKRKVRLAAIAQNNVIQDADAEQLASVHQAFGQGAVFLRRLRRAAWVVVAANQRGGVGQDGGLERLARMNHAGGQAAHRDGVDADQLVLLIQHGD
jgi:hypothetical protein